MNVLPSLTARLTFVKLFRRKIMLSQRMVGRNAYGIEIRCQGAMKIKEYDMQALVTRFVDDESAATAIEYGLIAAGISVAIIAAVTALGTQISATMTYVATTMASAGK